MAALAVTGVAARGLPPLLPRHARILVLGSFPGVASLAAAQYYAHPRNHFWPVLGTLLDEPLSMLPYRARLERLSARGVALWDTIVACERKGSSDGSIRNAERAEISRVRRASPGIEVVAFNGNTAARALPRWREAGYATLALPSTSPAYTRSFTEKLAAWRALEPWIDRCAAEAGTAGDAMASG
jgi:hypoxanthine-DNA glycosylase